MWSLVRCVSSAGRYSFVGSVRVWGSCVAREGRVRSGLCQCSLVASGVWNGLMDAVCKTCVNRPE